MIEAIATSLTASGRLSTTRCDGRLPGTAGRARKAHEPRHDLDRERGIVLQHPGQQAFGQREIALLDRDVRPDQRAAREAADFLARRAQVLARLVQCAALTGRFGKLAVVVRDRALLRRPARLLELAEDADRPHPLLLLLVDAHQLAHRGHAVGARGRERLEDLLGAVEHAGLQVVLRQREARLLALVRLERLARGDVLVDLDRAVHLAPAAIEAAEREMGLDGVVVELHGTQERLEGAVGLLVDQEVHAGEVVAAQALLADGARPRLARRVETDGAAEEQDPEQDPDRFRVHAVRRRARRGARRLSPGSGGTVPH